MMDDDGYKDAGKIVRLGYDEDHMSVHILIEGAGNEFYLKYPGLR